MKFVRHDMQRHFNRLLVILSYTCNNFGPLIKEKDLDTLEKKVEKEDIDAEEDDENAEDTLDDVLKDFYYECPVDESDENDE